MFAIIDCAFRLLSAFLPDIDISTLVAAFAIIVPVQKRNMLTVTVMVIEMLTIFLTTGKMLKLYYVKCFNITVE